MDVIQVKMKITKKTGIAMGLLLLPVFLYLLLSIPIRPATVVPDEYKKSIKNYFSSDTSVFDGKVSLVFLPSKDNLFATTEKILWFDQLFDDKFANYQLLIYSGDHSFVQEDVVYNQLSPQVHLLKSVDKQLVQLIKSYGVESPCFLLVDDKGGLRGVYALTDEKDQIKAKTETFILLQNL